MTASGERRRWFARPHPVVAVGLVLVAAGVVFRGWAVADAWFFFDDFHFIAEAVRSELTLGYLLTPYNGHLMPAGLLLTWLNTTLAPMSFGPVAVEMLVLYAAAGLGMLRLLCTLFGTRAAVLWPLTFYLVSPILIPATTWWAAGVNYLPVLVAVSWGVDAYVRHLRAPTRRTLVQSIAWVVLGLAFAELTLLVYLFLGHLTLSYFTTGALTDRLRQTWRRYRAAVVGHTVLVVAYLAFYVPHAMNFHASDVVDRPMFEVARAMVATAFASAVVGGPGRWELMRVTQSAADPTQLVQLLSWAVLLLLVHASVTTRRRAGRAWALPTLVLAASVALVSVSRAIYFGPEIALDYRFQTLAAPAMALALGLAFLPVPGAVESVEKRADHWLVDDRRRATAALAAGVGFAVLSTARYPLLHLTEHDPRAYFDRVVASSRDVPADEELIDLPVPPWLWFGPPETTPYSVVFAALGDLVPRARETVTDGALLVTEDGTVRPAVMEVVRRDTLPLTGSCPHPVGETGSHVRLDGPVVGYVWFVEIDYTTAYDGTIEVHLGDHVVEAPVQAGSHTLLLPGAGEYDTVTVRAGPGSQPGLCVQAVRVGTLRPGVATTGTS